MWRRFTPDFSPDAVLAAARAIVLEGARRLDTSPDCPLCGETMNPQSDLTREGHVSYWLCSSRTCTGLVDDQELHPGQFELGDSVVNLMKAPITRPEGGSSGSGGGGRRTEKPGERAYRLGQDRQRGGSDWTPLGRPDQDPWAKGCDRLTSKVLTVRFTPDEERRFAALVRVYGTEAETMRQMIEAIWSLHAGQLGRQDEAQEEPAPLLGPPPGTVGAPSTPRAGSDLRVPSGQPEPHREKPRFCSDSVHHEPPAKPLRACDTCGEPMKRARKPESCCARCRDYREQGRCIACGGIVWPHELPDDLPDLPGGAAVWHPSCEPALVAR